MPARQSTTVLRDWIERVNDEGKNLSQWELEFMESITDQFDRTRSLSPSQEEHLERIYATRTK